MAGQKQLHTQQRENTKVDQVKDLTQGGIVGPLFRLSMPIMGAQFMQMAYSLTDLFWLGQLGGTQVASVSIIGFYLWLCNCFAYITKVGVEVTIAQSIGQGRRNKAKQYAAHAALLALLSATVYAFCSFILSGPLVGFFGVEKAVASDAVLYMHWVIPAFFFSFVNQTLTGIFNGTGNSSTPFRINAAGLLLNIVLDPLLIYGIGPFPRLELVGAAIATSTAQAVVFVWLVLRLYSHESPLGRITLWSHLRRDVAAKLYAIGLPVGIQNACYCLLSIGVGRIAAQYGYAALAAQGLGGQIEGLSYMTSGGLATALGAFVGQNYGAKQWHRILRGFQWTTMLVAGIGLLIGSCFYLFSEEIFGGFVKDPLTVAEGERYLRYVAFAQLFMMTEGVASGSFYGLGKSTVPAMISILFNIARIPLALWMITFPSLGVAGIWLALTLTCVFKGVLLPSWFWFYLKQKGSAKQ